MTREQKIEKARRLKAMDVRIVAIARGLSEPVATVRGWTFDVPWPERECCVCENKFTPDHGNRKVCCGENARKRFHDDHARTKCADCGVDCHSGSSYRGVARCRGCYVESLKREKAERDDLIVSLWNQGLSLAQIGERLGTTVGSIGVSINELRHAGRHVPYRNRGYDRFPEQVAA